MTTSKQMRSPKQYKHLPPIARSRFTRILLIVAGSFFVAMGLIGAFVPILPTTPFLLLAAACYLRSSERLYHWLFTNPLFGEYLRRYRDGEGLPLTHKVLTLLLLWGTLGYSIFFVVPDHLWWVKLLLAIIGIGVTIHVLKIKTRRR